MSRCSETGNAEEDAMRKTKRFRLLVCHALLLAGCASTEGTGPYDIVAIGASNTEGRGRGQQNDGVSLDQAYPAQLERLLQSQGCHVRVLNAGRAGETMAETLTRVPGVVGKGTKVVILDTATNDWYWGGGSTAANIERIQLAVAERGAKTVILEADIWRDLWVSYSNGFHFSAEGYARVAAYLAPKVRAAGICSN
jgi:acyl-CoA thioesterase-1